MHTRLNYCQKQINFSGTIVVKLNKAHSFIFCLLHTNNVIGIGFVAAYFYNTLENGCVLKTFYLFFQGGGDKG